MKITGQQWSLNSEAALQNFLVEARSRIDAGKPVTVCFCEALRSPDQNSMFHGLVKDVSALKKDESEAEIKRYCKLHFGVPLARENEKFRSKYDQSVKNFDYSTKLLCMDLLPVTSLLSKRQFSIMLEQILAHYAEAGYPIPLPKNK